MPYDIPTAQQIATTVLGYENDKTRNDGFTKTLLHKVTALSTGQPSSDLGWWVSLEHGALPYTLTRANYQQEHLLEMAVVFNDHPGIRAGFLARMNQDLESYSEFHEGTNHWRSIQACALPAPDHPRLRFKKARRESFHPAHAAWYEPAALVRAADEELRYGHSVGYFLGQAAEALSRAGMSPDILRDVATKFVLKQLGKKATGSTDYLGIAQAIALANSDAVSEALAKEPGMLRILGVTLPKSVPGIMIAGLRQIAVSAKLELLSRIGRPISVEELLASNVKGAVEVWRRMPWAILQPLVRSHGSDLRAALLRRSEVNPDQLRTVLVDHPDRLELRMPSEITDPDGMEVIPTDPRAPTRLITLRERAAYYFPAVRLREILTEAYPMEVVRLIALRHLSPERHAALGQYIEPILTDAARAALTSYAVPPR